MPHPQIYQFYHTQPLADESGNCDARTPGRYMFNPPEGWKMYVGALCGVIADASGFLPNNYGGRGRLENGIVIGYQKSGITHTIPKLIHENMDWMLYTEHIRFYKFERTQGGGVMNVHLHFYQYLPHGKDLVEEDLMVLHHGDYVWIEVQDNLLPLYRHCWVVQGVMMNEN